MARRTTSEVLITGDKVDPRTRVGASSPIAKSVAKKPVGAFPTESSERRPRTIPKVIELAGDPVAKPNAASELAALERELGMTPTAAIGEVVGDTLPDPVPRKKPEKDLNWQEIHRAKKPELDLLPQTDPAPKNTTSDKFDLSQPVVQKPVIDIPVPGKAPVKTGTTGTAAPKMQSRMIAETVVSSILERIKDEARKNGGQLSLANIDNLRNEFDAQTQALSLAFEKSFEAYIRARERAAWNNKRDFPFDRLIVKKFSHLFADKKSGFDRVSRRMLPGFFMAVGMMLGLDVVDGIQERCRVIVERIRNERGEAFDWSDVYESDEKTIIVIDALMPIALHFEDYEKRRDWFLGLINGHLTSPAESDKADAGWEMTIPAFGYFFEALMTDLKAELASEKGKSRIVKRYGTEAANMALRILNKRH
ncbi:MAG: hypothetical protein HQ483_04800 [Rhodospirillales bacterium]|nr:hypothetical protein [Rhodospirillales bacterium]